MQRGMELLFLFRFFADGLGVFISGQFKGVGVGRFVVFFVVELVYRLFFFVYKIKGFVFFFCWEDWLEEGVVILREFL